MSKEKTSFVYVTYIRSTPEKVFEAITRPEIARRYWGHENVSDWKPGSRWEHVRADEQRTVQLVGEVVEVRAADAPGHHLGERLAGRRSGQLQPRELRHRAVRRRWCA